MTLKKFIIAVALVAGTSLFANAQQTVSPAPPMEAISASRLKAAEDMLAATGLSTQMDAMYSTMIDANIAQIPADNKERFKAIMTNFLKKYMSYDLLKNDLAKIYAEEFTEQELKDITKFYLTPAGKKVNQKMAALMQKGVVLGQNRMQAHLTEFQDELKKAFPNQ